MTRMSTVSYPPAAESQSQAWDLSRQGRRLFDAGRVDAGLDLMRKAASLAPENPYLQINPLTHSHYLEGTTRRECYQHYVQWARRFVPISAVLPPLSDWDCDPDRCLRVGYLSADFRRHSVATTFEPVLDGMDRRLVQSYGYGNVAQPDNVTIRLRRKFDAYQDIHGWTRPAVVDRIRRDRIDVLVHLGGHTAGNCLEILAEKPAPIQVDMGGLCTTGMEQVDYRITDVLYDPPEARHYYVERCIDLPGGLSCFRPPQFSPLVTRLPALSRGRLTFGVFSQAAKITPMMMDLWGRILNRLPGAMLVIKCPGGQDVEVKNHFERAFARHGQDTDRLRVLGQLPFQEYLALFGEIDLLLDTFPYNGGVTTLEGLWMGVPTLSLTGDTFVARAGLSILSRVGLEIFCCSAAGEVEQKALSFAGQIHELDQIRQGLRARMLASSLCDAGRMSRELTGIYRDLWQTWCREH